ADMAVQGKLFGLDNQVSVGFDVSTSTFRHTNNTYSGSSPSVDPYHPVPGYFHSDAPTIPRYRNEADQYALFIEDRLALTERWSVLGGLRYDHTDVARKDLVFNRSAFDRTYADIGWRLGSV